MTAQRLEIQKVGDNFQMKMCLILCGSSTVVPTKAVIASKIYRVSVEKKRRNPDGDN